MHFNPNNLIFKSKKYLLTGLFFASLLHPAAAAKNFVFCSDDDPESFNPMLTTTATSASATAATIYKQLMQFSLDSTDLDSNGGLVEKYVVAPDNLTYTFTLRKNIPFHSNELFKPTRALNADDIIFSFMRQHDKDHPYHKVSNMEYDYPPVSA